jgi:hypothetical protein
MDVLVYLDPRSSARLCKLSRKLNKICTSPAFNRYWANQIRSSFGRKLKGRNMYDKYKIMAIVRSRFQGKSAREIRDIANYRQGLQLEIEYIKNKKGMIRKIEDEYIKAYKRGDLDQNYEFVMAHNVKLRGDDRMRNITPVIHSKNRYRLKGTGSDGSKISKFVTKELAEYFARGKPIKKDRK